MKTGHLKSRETLALRAQPRGREIVLVQGRLLHTYSVPSPTHVLTVPLLLSEKGSTPHSFPNFSFFFILKISLCMSVLPNNLSAP